MLKPQCLRLYSPREWIHKAVSLRETQGDIGRYKEMKREKTHTHRNIYVLREGGFIHRNQDFAESKPKCVILIQFNSTK